MKKNSLFFVFISLFLCSCQSANAPKCKVVDLVMFMGQSNMAGRGDYKEAPKVNEGAGFEFKAISDPTKLYPLNEPFGKNENNNESGVSETTKTGSMVSSFVNSYYKYTNTPIVGVSCSKGGTKIDFWAPGSAPLNDAINRHEVAKAWLFENGYTIRNDFMVWCQGESDGDNGTTYNQYKISFKAMLEEIQNSTSIDKCFMVRIGNHRDNSTLYDEIIRAQTDIAKEDDDIILVSTRFASMAREGLMKDTFHYYQKGYNLTGEEAGKNTAFYINNGIEPEMYDYEYETIYSPFVKNRYIME